MFLRLLPNEIFCLKFTKELKNKDNINNLKFVRCDNANYIYCFINTSKQDFIAKFVFENAELYIPVEVFDCKWEFVTSASNITFRSKVKNTTLTPSIKWYDNGVCFEVTCNTNDIIEIKPNFDLCRITVLGKCHCELLDKGGNNIFTTPLGDNNQISFIVKFGERLLASTSSSRLIVKVEKAVL